MCGISVIFGPPETAREHLDALHLMHQSLAHRGPDGEGCLLVDAHLRGHAFGHLPALHDVGAEALRLSVGFRRLSIQDLRHEAGQPLTRGNGMQWIVLNGEIYNFKELRQILAEQGYTFRTHSDTEVALAAYAHWGTACFERFNGMWALLIIDLERRKLIGSRDRLGIKPLFYAVDAGRLLFASEAQAIAKVQRQGPTVRAAQLIDFLRGRPNQVTACSFFAGVELVPAATFFEMDLAHAPIAPPHFHPYWNLADAHCTGATLSFGQATEEFAALLRSAVAYQTVADVPVGCLLSGGIDSSMLTRLAALSPRNAKTLPKTFSVVFDDPRMNESSYIDAVLQMGGVDGQRSPLSAEGAWALIDQVTTAYGDPLLGHYVLAYYHVLGLARSHGTRVILDGQGADELLGGYNHLETAALCEKLTSGHWRAFSKELGLLARQHQTSRWTLLRSRVGAYYTHRLMGKLPGRLGRPRYAWLKTRPQETCSPEADDYGRDRSRLNQLLYHLTKYSNLPYVLLLLDRLSMAHGLELRVPYLDHRLVEFCFRQPASYKIANGERKRLLRAMARHYLPAAVTERTYKMGITSNLHWLPVRARHGALLREMLASPTLRQFPWLRPQALTQFVEGYLAGTHNDALAVWRLYTAWRWLEIFRPRLVTGM